MLFSACFKKKKKKNLGRPSPTLLRILRRWRRVFTSFPLEKTELPIVLSGSSRSAEFVLCNTDTHTLFLFVVLVVCCLYIIYPGPRMCWPTDLQKNQDKR